METAKRIGPHESDHVHQDGEWRRKPIQPSLIPGPCALCSEEDYEWSLWRVVTLKGRTFVVHVVCEQNAQAMLQNGRAK